MKLFDVIFYLLKAPYRCYGFEFKECGENPLNIIDQSTCPVIEERNETAQAAVRIELDDSLLKSFNELSENELKFAFGTFTPVQSLNPYMTKLSLCSITKVGFHIISRSMNSSFFILWFHLKNPEKNEIIRKTNQFDQKSIVFYRRQLFRLDPSFSDWVYYVKIQSTYSNFCF